MILLTGFQRFVLSQAEPRHRKRLARSITTYINASEEDRAFFVAPYRRMSKPLVVWVLLRIGVDRPALVVGAGLSAACYCVIAARAVYKIFN